MDGFKDTLSNVTKSVYKTSKGFIKSTKLSIDLSGEESRLKALYTDIGKKVHEIYSYGGSLGKFFDDKYKEILECEDKIDELRKALEISKGVKACPKCGKTASVSAEFCPKCGGKLGEFTEIPQILAAPDEIEIPAASSEPIKAGNMPVEPVFETIVKTPPTKKCPVCGKENSSADKFCLSCGRII